MGIFSKLFSIRRKSKKRAVANHSAEPLPPMQVHPKPCPGDDAEAEACRLLRSSSGRFAAESQPGLASLPPLPHPIDSVIPPPKASSTTLASVSGRSTYSVTVHGRTVHSRTEFPNAYPPMDKVFTPKRSLTDAARRRSNSVPLTPRDNNRLLALRQDPSVASLLNHYDDEGHLDSGLFSNTPSPRKDGRIQRRRTGSTLRQLLGHPSSPELRNSSTEGDISWAEKFLGETDGNSSVSSASPQTPTDAHFTHTHSIDDNTVLSVECDTSSTNHRTFSSLEVELSVSTDLAHPHALDSPYGNPMTPQRASQIFGFLSDKKKALDGPVSRLPQLKTTTAHYRRFSIESSTSDTKHSNIPLPRRSSPQITQSTSPTNQRRFSLAAEASESPPLSPTAATFLPPQPEDEEPEHRQTVISQHTGQSNRGPRGPRPPSKLASQYDVGPLPAPCDVDDSRPMMEQPPSTQSILGGKSNTDDKCTGIATAQPRKVSQIPKLRTASGSSSGSMEENKDANNNSARRNTVFLQPNAQEELWQTTAGPPTGMAPQDMENDILSRLPKPVTPARPIGLHPHRLREPPSPASSSELSPVAKQMMANLRQQRIRARERERRAGRLGSSQSRIRY